MLGGPISQKGRKNSTLAAKRTLQSALNSRRCSGNCSGIIGPASKQMFRGLVLPQIPHKRCSMSQYPVTKEGPGQESERSLPEKA